MVLNLHRSRKHLEREHTVDPKAGFFYITQMVLYMNRNQYHYAVRRTVKMSNAIRARKLFEASETGSCQLLKEMKKIKGSKKEASDVPDVVGGVSVESQVVEEFRKVYSALYK